VVYINSCDTIPLYSLGQWSILVTIERTRSLAYRGVRCCCRRTWQTCSAGRKSPNFVWRKGTL